jgi:hypothetical protein
MLRNIAQGVLGILGILVLCIVALVLLQYIGSIPPGTWANPPLYPGAQQVRVQDLGPNGIYEPTYYGVFTMKVITYTVADTPEKVRSFYTDALEHDRWQLETLGPAAQSPSQLAFMWTTGGRVPSEYFVMVSTMARPQGGTEVALKITRYPGY